MNLIYLLFITVAFTFSDSTDLNVETKNQLAYYAENIERGKNEFINNWALNVVASQNCEIKNNALKLYSNNPNLRENLKSTECDNFDVDGNFTFFSTTESSVINKYQFILERDSVITEELVGYNESPLLHFSLLIDTKTNSLYSKEYLTKALTNWESSLTNLKNNRSHLTYSIVLTNIIWAAFLIDEYEVVNKYYTEFIENKYFPISNYKLKILGAFDYTFYLYGEYDKSLSLQRNHSLPLAKFIGSQSDIQSIKNRQGAYLFSLGKYQESKKIYEQLYNESESVDDQYALFTNLAVNYLMLGQSNRYVAFQLKALDQDISNYKSLLSIYRNLFLYYTSVQDVNTALDYINKAKTVAISNSDTTELALIDSFLGTFYWSTYQDHEQALKFLSSASENLTPNRNFSSYSDLLTEKGQILFEIDSLNSARKIFQEAKSLSLSKSNTPKYIDALVNLTLLDLKQNHLDSASIKLNEIKLYSLDNLNFELLTKYYTTKAKYLCAIGKQRNAIEELKPVLEQIINRAKNNVDTQQGYWSVQKEYLDAFSLMITLHIETNQVNEALLLLEQLKTINDASLYNSPLVKAAKLSEEDLAEEKRLNQKLQNLRKKFLNADSDQKFALKTEINRTTALREQILAKANLSREENIPAIWHVQRAISPDELLLHFTEIENDLYVTHLTFDKTIIKKFDFSPEKKEQIAQIADQIAKGNTDLQKLYELYKILEIEFVPDHIQTITVIPDNHLYRIPLEVLPVQQPETPISYGSTRYLIEDYHFRYFTSLKEFLGNRRTNFSKASIDFSAFAISDFDEFKYEQLPSLPYATVETERIEHALSTIENKNIYTGDNATKNKFLQEVSRSRMVHVATHSEVSDQDPLFSTIYLKSSHPDDTLDSDQALYAYELFDTNLTSEFIMLNSCSSGSGNYIQGSGVMGISRALRYAGAKSLALNLWSVNDKIASDFATDFYHYLDEGLTKNEALRKAKLNQLQFNNANPHFWGAYLMIGNPSPITEKPANYWLIYSLMAFTLVITGYGAYSKK